MAKTRRVGKPVRAGTNRTGRAGASRNGANQGGGVLLGFMAGLIVGLGIAVVVALFVTRAPVPFMSKATRAPGLVEPRAGAVLPDPNAPLQSRSRGDSDAPTASAGPSLPQTNTIAPAPGVPAPQASAAPQASTQGSSQGSSQAGAAEGGYTLQAGAFRGPDEADGMRARLALLGFEAKVIPADVNGQTMYRVRIGPFAQLDDMNRARGRLADGGIEASVIRQR